MLIIRCQLEGPQHRSWPLLSHLIICCVCLQLIALRSFVRLPLRKQRVSVHDDEYVDGDGEMMLGRWQLESEWIFACVKHARKALEGGGAPCQTYLLH